MDSNLAFFGTFWSLFNKESSSSFSNLINRQRSLSRKNLQWCIEIKRPYEVLLCLILSRSNLNLPLEQFLHHFPYLTRVEEVLSLHEVTPEPVQNSPRSL